ncbi:MAG: hypothetical protein HY321_13570 [Armatimonadetes bacterium]|nr:hypothetical protein [Armatimonadota bacterium]
MRYYLLVGLLAAAIAGGCGGGSGTLVRTDLQPAPSGADMVPDAALGERFTVPPAPEGAGIETHTDQALGFSIQFPSDQFALFAPPQYVTVLGNRVFELVQRTLPEGDLFRPNVGMITDPRFAGQPITPLAYVNDGLGILQAFYESFELVAGPTGITVDEQDAATIEFLGVWQAPDGTLVPFHRKNVYVKHDGEFLIFTFTTPRGRFEGSRAAFDAMIDSIELL